MDALNINILKDIKPTEGQARGISMVQALAKASGTQVAVLTGYAGTGKTTLLRIISQLIGGIVVIAPTGKAAMRVTEATGLPASTIHRWLYTPQQNPRTGEVQWVLKKPEDIEPPDSGVIVVDESSMVDEALWNDILKTADAISCRVLAVGDPFQLPPVTKSDGSEVFSVLNPRLGYVRTELTEVMRQALDNPIIRASMMIRKGQYLEAMLELPVISSTNLIQEAERVQAGGGIVICHKNTSRQYLNREIRTRRGLGPEIQAGEPLLVLRNNYELNRFNGETAVFNGWEHLNATYSKIYNPNTHSTVEGRFGRAKVDNIEVAMCLTQVFGEIDEKQVTMSNIERVAAHNVSGRLPYLHANLGYAYTCHKSQGSEWPEVVVAVEPSVRADSLEGRRWLYTAVTRASKTVGICWGVKLT